MQRYKKILKYLLPLQRAPKSGASEINGMNNNWNISLSSLHSEHSLLIIHTWLGIVLYIAT